MQHRCDTNPAKEAVSAHDEQPQGVGERLIALLARPPLISQGAPPERLDADARRYKVKSSASSPAPRRPEQRSSEVPER